MQRACSESSYSQERCSPPIPAPAPPLIDAGVSNASARATWAGDNVCPAADQPISRGYQDLAHANVLNPTGFTAIGINNNQQGVSYTTGTTALPQINPAGDQ